MSQATSPPMPLDKALRYANKFVEMLAPACERIKIAGSIRRQRPMCSDIDLLVIPKVTKDTDLLGFPTAGDNLLARHLKKFVADLDEQQRPTWVTGEQVTTTTQHITLQFPKCKLEIYFATPDTWDTRLLCRTGSKEHNIWLAQQAIAKGYHWNPYDGLQRNGATIPVQSEQDIYATLNLPYREPTQRDGDFR